MSKFFGLVCSAAMVLAASSNVYGQGCNKSADNKSTEKNEKSMFFQQGLPLDVNNPRDGKYPMGYNAPAAVMVDSSWDIDVSAAYTYWYASQDAMDVAFTVPALAAVGTPGHVAYQNFGYASGFKVGVGFDLSGHKSDDWSVDAEYTWYDKTQSATTAATTGTLLTGSGLFHAAETGTSVFSSWQLKLNQLDLEGGRPFYQGKCVTLSPAGGLRVLWIQQAQVVNLLNTGGDTNGATAHSSSWALGPKVGINSHWMVWKGLRLDTVMGGSLLYTRYTHINVGESTVTAAGVTTASVTSSATDVAALRPTMDMGLGLGYGAYMFDNKFFFDLSARYDFMQYWSQNVMRNYSSQLAGRDDAIGDLRMHGLTVNLRCDF